MEVIENIILFCIINDTPSVYYPIVCEGKSEEEILLLEEQKALPDGICRFYKPAYFLPESARNILTFFYASDILTNRIYSI